MSCRIVPWARAGFVATLGLTLCSLAPAAGLQPVEEAIKPLQQRLALIDREMRPLQSIVNRGPAPAERPQALHDRARAWARLQDLMEEQSRLNEEIAQARQDAKNPLRIY